MRIERDEEEKLEEFFGMDVCGNCEREIDEEIDRTLEEPDV